MEAVVSPVGSAKRQESERVISEIAHKLTSHYQKLQAATKATVCTDKFQMHYFKYQIIIKL